MKSLPIILLTAAVLAACGAGTSSTSSTGTNTAATSANAVVGATKAASVATNAASVSTSASSTGPTKVAEAKFQASPNSMLWNPGPNWRAALEQDATTTGATCDEPGISDMSQAINVGNPSIAPPLYCGGTSPINPGGTAPSYFHNTFGWTPAQYTQYPGWAVWYLSGGYGTPIDFRIFNNSYSYTPQPNLPIDQDPSCALREVSTSYVGWRNLAQWKGYNNIIATPNATVFRQMYDPRIYSTITGTFSAKLDSASPASNCGRYPTNRIETDFAVQYFDSNSNILRTDVLGVSLFDEYPGNNLILFQSGCAPAGGACSSSQCAQSSIYCQIALNGQMLGYPALTSNFQTYNVEYMGLLRKYFPPAPVGTVKGLVIVYEVYSTARGADNSFELTNMDLIGQVTVP